MKATDLEPAAGPAPPQGSPARKRVELLIVFGVAFVWLRLVLIDDGHMDQYHHLRYAQRVCEGELPYRDFSMWIWPGYAYLVSIWFSVFGFGMDTIRLLGALLGAACVTLAAAAASRAVSSPLRWVAPAGVLSTLVAGSEGLIHTALTVPLCMAAVWAAVEAETRGRARFWFLAGCFAALAGACTQNVGAWLGVGLTLAALMGSRGTRLRSAGACVGGALIVLVPMLVFLLVNGLWADFVRETWTWVFERYRNYHAGVHWGSWMRPWTTLSKVEYAWWPVAAPYLLLLRAGVFGFPLLLAGSALRAAWRRHTGQPPEPLRRVLWLACAATMVSYWPHGGTLHILRILAPLWLLLSFELERLQIWGSGTVHRRKSIASGILVALLLLSALYPLKAGSKLRELETPRGRVRIRAEDVAVLQVLSRFFKPGDPGLVLPIYEPPVYLLALKNPTSYEGLQPVFHSPEQLRRAADQLKAAGKPPVIFFHFRAFTEKEELARLYGPAAHLDELDENPLWDFVLRSGEYRPAYEEKGLLTIYVSREAAWPGPQSEGGP